MFLPQPVREKCYYWSTEGFSTLCSLITQSISELLETAFSAGGWWYHPLNSDARQHWKDKLVMPFISVYFPVNLIDCSLLTGIAFCGSILYPGLWLRGLQWLVCTGGVLTSPLCLSSDSFLPVYAVKSECERDVSVWYRQLLMKWKQIVSPEFFPKAGISGTWIKWLCQFGFAKIDCSSVFIMKLWWLEKVLSNRTSCLSCGLLWFST